MAALCSGFAKYNCLTLLFAIFGQFSRSHAVSPLFQWPLVDTSGLGEVRRGKDTFTADDNKQCFIFGRNFDELGDDVIQLGESSAKYLTTTLNNKERLLDITISFLVFAIEEPRGTLLHYTIAEKEYFRLTFHPVAPIAFISFRDEYDNPAGIISVENLLTLGYWNHIVIQRRYLDGQVRVYSNGVLEADKDEMDDIALPLAGTLTIGNTLNDDDQQFTGYLSCMQIFPEFLSEEEMDKIWTLCRQEYWKMRPKVYLVGDSYPDKQCLTDVPPTAPPIPYHPTVDNQLTMTAVVNENLWRSIRAHYKWEDGGKTSAYFNIIAANGAPYQSDESIGSVNTTDMRTCSRLCMRIRGCQTFAYLGDGFVHEWKPCVLYDKVHKSLRKDTGFRYFAMTQ